MTYFVNSNDPFVNAMQLHGIAMDAQRAQHLQNLHNAQINNINFIGNQLRLELAHANERMAANEAAFFQSLLKKPFNEIAAVDPDFAYAYYALMLSYTENILAAKAYKDIAYDYATTLGYNNEEINAEFLLRVNEISEGKNPNEKMPEQLDIFTEFAQKSLNDSRI